tara:strand:+ start:84 stop:269 length:186 start_codon:yes stop_codon:yes gene_type:complete
MKLNKKDLKFIIDHLDRYIRNKECSIRECLREEEKQFWDRFFQVTETKKILEKVEKVHKNA